MLTTIKKILTSKWKFIAILIVVIAIGGFWYWNRQKTTQKSLTFIKPERGELVKTLEVSGSVTAKEYAKMRFSAGGKVVYLGAKEGDVVKKWQTIATIDKASLQNSLEQTLNLYSKERLDWEQQLDDIDDRWIPKDEERSVNKNQLDLNNTVLSVQATDIAIKNTVLSSPFDGVLISSPTNVTNVNLLATDVFEVINPETILFKAIVDELDISQIQTGQSVDVVLDSYPDQVFPSTIDFISYKSSQTSTSTVFLVDIPLKDMGGLDKFRIGLNGDATITLDKKADVLYVPLDATKKRNDETYVDIKIGPDKTEERKIETGMETDDYLEVISGLNENDEILMPE